jgi:para-aminobenzoate synthetase component 1
MLDWADQFSILLLLDSNEYERRHPRYECLVAVDAVNIVEGSLTALQEHHDVNKDWLFGHICYDHKNELESKLGSTHPQAMGFPSLHFFTPRIVCYISADRASLIIESIGIDPADVFAAIMGMEIRQPAPLPQLNFKQRTVKEHYLSAIAHLRKHIADGDCYEINYCTEGYCEGTSIHPLDAFKRLNEISPAPYAAYYKLEDKYMMCASPERYLLKQGSKLTSQPIKGTARRGVNSDEDEQIKSGLRSSIKERAENVMITDLTRNDLARVCEIGSVEVEELFGIYSYPRVHQMISTISGTMRKGIPLTDAIRYSFPMGSMTGAPKMKVMQLVDRYEEARRELYSGTVGYINPSGDFDFNVVIRSLFYNAATKYLSYQAGGAITYDSDAEMEWQEMRLKASAMEQVFS